MKFMKFTTPRTHSTASGPPSGPVGRSRGAGRGRRSNPPVLSTRASAAASWHRKRGNGGRPKRSSSRPTSATTAPPASSAWTSGVAAQSLPRSKSVAPMPAMTASPPPRGVTARCDERAPGWSRSPLRRAIATTSGVPRNEVTKPMTRGTVRAGSLTGPAGVRAPGREWRSSWSAMDPPPVRPVYASREKRSLHAKESRVPLG